MFNWLRAAIIGVAMCSFAESYSQVELSLENALKTAYEHSYPIKNSTYTSELINEDIKGAKKEITMPSGSSSWSTNKDFRHIVSINAGLDYKFGRFAAVKYHKNRLENHLINSGFVHASVRRDIHIIYARAKKDNKLIRLYADQKQEIETILLNASDSIMRDALSLTCSSYLQKLKHKSSQQALQLDSDLEELYSLMNVNRPDERIDLSSEIILDTTLYHREDLLPFLQESARILHFQNIDRAVENKILEQRIVRGKSLPHISLGYRLFYDDFTNATDNSAFIGLSVPILNKGQTRKQINKKEIEKRRIIDRAQYQKRTTAVTVKKEFNSWQKALDAIPSSQEIHAAKQVYDFFKTDLVNYTPQGQSDAMERAQLFYQAMITYFSLQEKNSTTITSAYEQEMRLRQTHIHFNHPLIYIGQQVHKK
jgi:hypothetical protein